MNIVTSQCSFVALGSSRMRIQVTLTSGKETLGTRLAAILNSAKKTPGTRDNSRALTTLNDFLGLPWSSEDLFYLPAFLL